MKNNLWRVIDFCNKHKATQNLYPFLKKHIKKGDFKIDSLASPKPYADEKNENPRITILLPSLRKSKVFGGISTALDFFYKIVDQTPEIDARIIVISGETFDENLTINMGEYSKENKHKQLLFLADDKNVEVRKNDVFIFTTWGSAYSFSPVVEWIEKHFNKKSKSIYLIQDYEPGFAAWSAWYALAEATYKNRADSTIAVFNSKELYEYFKFNGYQFSEEYYFRPSLNEKLKEKLLNVGHNLNRKKTIIIYGRPNEPRNAFEIIRYSLKLWSERYPHANEWKIISMGAPVNDIKFMNNTLKSLGKVSLDKYAKTMLEAYAGISLMISPHPSYPPLEMSTFGVKTITNNFCNKNLSDFNDNINSIDKCTPEEICRRLSEICDSYSEVNSREGIIMNESYLEPTDFYDVIKAVQHSISQRIS